MTYELKYTQDPDLEPLELSKEEENVVIARMKKLAKDPANEYANALELVHQSYMKQNWERQQVIGDLIRPSPPDRAAWKQYEKFIQLAVKLLSKYRGINGTWRSERFDTIPTNQRASMGSMAASRIKNEHLAKQSRYPLITEAIMLSDSRDSIIANITNIIDKLSNGLYTVEFTNIDNGKIRIVVNDEIGLPIDIITI